MFADGGAHVAGSPDNSASWADIAKAAYQSHKCPRDGVGSGGHGVLQPGNATWPFGTHLAVVEVDPETGNVDLLKYVGVDDCGNVINPMIVDGQVHGGIAQGIGQALFEEARSTTRRATCSPASLVDYIHSDGRRPPMFELVTPRTPTDVNPLGVKGIGEAGTIASAHTMVNAVVDALAPLGVKHIDMPLRPSGCGRRSRKRGAEGHVSETLRVPRSRQPGRGAGRPRPDGRGQSAVRRDEPAGADEAAPGRLPARWSTSGGSPASTRSRTGRPRGHRRPGPAWDHGEPPAHHGARHGACPGGVVDRRRPGAQPGHDVWIACPRRHRRRPARRRHRLRCHDGGAVVGRQARDRCRRLLRGRASTSALEPDEILVEVRIPKGGGASAYDKMGRRGGHSDYAVAGAAAWVRKYNGSVSDARIGLTGVGTSPRWPPRPPRRSSAATGRRRRSPPPPTRRSTG